MLRAFFYFLFFIPWTLFVVLTAFPVSLFGENRVHRYGIIWGRGCLWLAGTKIRVQGAEHLPLHQSAVYIANHQSNFDIPALYAGLPIQFRWLAKKELFDVPLFGPAMKRCGYIPIDRSDRRQAMHSLNEAARQISEGASVIVFPEGTRTEDGQLQDFKKGGFLIAVKAQVPIIPIAIKGSYQVMAKNHFQLQPGKIEIKIFPPIATAGLKTNAIDTLMQQAREPIAKSLQGIEAHEQKTV